MNPDGPKEATSPSFGAPCPFVTGHHRTCMQPRAVIGTKTTAELCESFLAAIFPQLRCKLANAWALDPVSGRLHLLATTEAGRTNRGWTLLDCNNHLIGAAVASKQITRHSDVRLPDGEGRYFSDKQLADRLNLRAVITVPVLNTSNPNQVLAVVTLFPETESDAPDDETLTPWFELLANQIETHLHVRCFRFANRLEIALAGVRHPTKQQLCQPLASVVRQATMSDWITVFLETPHQDKLRSRSVDGFAHLVDNDDIISRGLEYETWTQNREHLIPDLSKEKTSLVLDSQANTTDVVYTGMLVPLRDLSGRARGLMRCVNRCPRVGQDAFRPFTYDDVAILESIGQAFVPQLEFLLAEQTRIEMLSRLAHEMRVPVTAFRAAVEAIEMECEAGGMRFRYDHFREIHLYCDLQARLLRRLDLVRLGPYEVPLKSESTSMLTAIIAPAKRFVGPLLDRGGFSSAQIKYTGFDAMPRVFIDPGLMTEVVFNLMENAIKYFRGDPKAFRLEIDAGETDEFFEIVFRDNGIGVPVRVGESIFDAGVRGPREHLGKVTGEGLGLWVAQEIVRRHDGDVVLRSRHNPTEFVIKLRRYLQHRAPQPRPKRNRP